MDSPAIIGALPGFGILVLTGEPRRMAEKVVQERHYLHSIPSGKSHWMFYDGAIIVFSIPANPFISHYLLGDGANIWELSRMWAPDGHERNLLTMAMSAAVSTLRELEPTVDAIVAYADPNVGHSGFVYRAASWVACGQCDETRYYVSPDGQTVARRKFHSGRTHKTKTEITALGFVEMKRQGKLRYVKPMSRKARRMLLKNQYEQLGTN